MKVGVESFSPLKLPLGEDKYAVGPINVDTTQRCAQPAVSIKKSSLLATAEAPFRQDPAGEQESGLRRMSCGLVSCGHIEPSFFRVSLRYSWAVSS